MGLSSLQTYLLTSLNVFHSHELFRGFVAHEAGNSKVARSDVFYMLISLIVMQNGDLQPASYSHNRSSGTRNNTIHSPSVQGELALLSAQGSPFGSTFLQSKFRFIKNEAPTASSLSLL